MRDGVTQTRGCDEVTRGLPHLMNAHGIGDHTVVLLRQVMGIISEGAGNLGGCTMSVGGCTTIATGAASSADLFVV